MGYPSTAKGSIIIEPPLTAKELREHPELTTCPRDVGGKKADRWEQVRDAAILIHKHLEITDDGELVRISGREIVACGTDGEGYSRAHLVRDLNEIVSTFPERTYTGKIILTYKDDGSQEAYLVRDGFTMVLEPILTWPPDSEAKPAAE